MNKILICGATSFVAQGFSSLLQGSGYEVDTFSRGKQGTVCGNYSEIDKNNALAPQYDVVVNFAVLKDASTEDNINYAKALVQMCKEKGVKKLIHFSSIMVYNYLLTRVDENTNIEPSNRTWKDGYGKIKIAVDEYLLSVRDSLPFEVVLTRPGYVLADNRPCPFIKQLPFRVSIIKGNKRSRQPIVKREEIHQALIKIIETEHNDKVYHFFPNNGMTKYRYAKETVGGMVLIMPKWLFKGLPLLLCKIGIMPKALYSRFEGMYIESDFSSKLTEEKLDIKFS
ncbi:MAG: NAD(P)-dependent oxidoreductase [Bacteroidaceae bacterium]|nr:NAD(P)-dependent oxidoreductase [Bacteroidaceae bacterium]